MSRQYSTQIAIVGGGVCGLWLLASLLAEGRKAVLIEQEELGGAQTLASQGMIHGGIKYALGGFTTASSETIASMPQRWRQALAGIGTPDLSDVALASENYYLFSDNTVTSRVTAFFGSKSIRSRIEPVKRADLPACFDNPAFKGVVYRLEDIVVDTTSLIASLAKQGKGRIFKSGVSSQVDAEGCLTGLQLDDGILTANTYIFAAGAGNEALMASTALAGVAMQRRPLHQVMVKSGGLADIYAHAVSASAGAKPRVTLTTHRTRDGDKIWYLGGNLAETGVRRSSQAQIEFAKSELAALFPWMQWNNAEWRTFSVDRAEPAQKDHSRPDKPFCRMAGNAIVCWPTKLSLAPLLADEVIAALPPSPDVAEELPALEPPGVGLPPWDRAFT